MRIAPASRGLAAAIAIDNSAARCSASRVRGVFRRQPRHHLHRVDLYKLCEHKGRARDRCDHAWGARFRHVRVSIEKWSNREINRTRHARPIRRSRIPHRCPRTRRGAPRYSAVAMGDNRRAGRDARRAISAHRDVRVRRCQILIMATSPGGRRSRFETTEWSVVLAAGGENSSAARTALATLCETYWYPLYAYVRRQGHNADDAKDLTQAFFVRFLDKQAVHEVRRERGRFRSFLLASLRNFLLNDAEHQRTLKRGGGQIALPLDFETAEGRYLQEPQDLRTPERIFDRRWALTVLDRVLRRLRREWLDAGKGAEFDRLKVCLAGESPRGGYRELGQALGLTEGAVRVAVHRLRRQYQRRLREEIGRTVVTDDAVDEEIRYLFSALKT